MIQAKEARALAEKITPTERLDKLKEKIAGKVWNKSSNGGTSISLNVPVGYQGEVVQYVEAHGYSVEILGAKRFQIQW